MTKKSLIITAILALAILVVPGAAMAKSRDRNHDGIPDRWEKRHHLSLKVNQARRDQDHDGLRNRQEFRRHTNPRDADTDNDGLTDGQEVRIGDDPCDRDTDNDGINDAEENAGTVQSFDQGTDNDPNTGTLTIQLADGSTVTGEVNDATRIECHADELRASHHGGDNSGPGSDNSGPGSGEDRVGDDEDNCSAANLTPGAVVREAKLVRASDGTLTFTKIELESSSPSTP